MSSKPPGPVSRPSLASFCGSGSGPGGLRLNACGSRLPPHLRALAGLGSGPITITLHFDIAGSMRRACVRLRESGEVKAAEFKDVRSREQTYAAAAPTPALMWSCQFCEYYYMLFVVE